MNMEQANGIGLALLQAIAGQTQMPKTGGSGELDEFQKLLEEKSQEKDPLLEPPAKTEAPVKKPAEKDPVQKQEDPVEASKRMQVYLAPVDPGVLAQYPASWLPQNLQEGEPVVCIGVRSGENGEQIPILVGANTAEKLYGKPVVDPALYDVSDPEADSMLEATDPTVEHGPAQLLEKVVNEQTGKTVQQAVEEVKPQGEEDDAQVELLDSQQGPRQLFRDVEAAPVKVGEAYDVQETQEPDVARQIDTQLAQALEKGESMVRIQLTPEHLGSVTVEISQSADGILRVALSAHSAETRGLLERHAGDLQGMLSSRGQEVQVDVQRQQESQQGQNQQHQQNYDGHNGHAQDGQERRQQRREHTSPQDFMQQLRLGLIPGEE